ncbi:MAG: hypothetical protein R6V62_02995 [Candidatus Fermentibacteraceae bacterium]
MRTELVRPLLVCILLAPALLLFAETLSYGFMSDDFHLVYRVENEGFFYAWGGEDGDVYVRPLTVLSYFTDSMIYGLNPAGWHLTNVLWHLACSWLVFLLARVTLKDDTAAFSAAYLFLLLACHSESVAWVSGRTDLLATAFCLGSVLAFLRKSPWALLLFAAGLLAKESVLITPLLWLVLVVKTPVWDSRAKRLFVLGLAVALVYTAARIVLSGGVPPGAGEVSFSVAAESIARYMFRVFVPPLSEAARPFIARSPLALPLFLFATTACAVFFALRKNFDRRTFAVLVLGFFVSLLPVVFMRVSLLDTRSERFLYLPGVFAVLAIVNWVFQVFGKRTALVLLTALALFQGAFLYRSNMNWRRAGEMCGELIREPVAYPPDNYRGAYVFMNGYEEALLLFGE